MAIVTITLPILDKKGKMLISSVSSFTLGLALFTAYLLYSKLHLSKLYTPLILFFLVLATIQSYFLVGGTFSGDLELKTSISLTCLKQIVEINLAPLFWFYIRGVTSQTEIQLTKSDLKHFTIPLLISLLIAFSSSFIELFVFMAPLKNLTSIFFTRLNQALNIVIFTQLITYAVIVIKRISKSTHAVSKIASNKASSVKHFKFQWLFWIIVSTIALELAVQLYKYLTSDSSSIVPINFFLRAAIIWSFCAWGVSQRVEELIGKEEKKYRKSAMSEEFLADVCDKIQVALEKDKLYQDPALSLSSLSKSIGVLPNYVSQTINLRIGESFFDYINRLRINDAITRLERSKDTVLKISFDVGFNSRSSFYSAFKKVTDTTPKAYRDLKLSADTSQSK